ncbi:Acetyltransferase (isoleucine patch superfamily) [Lutibacter agarilyticus]|uniref:Acetyltransferase (Isoleucine patch superfamily) n=1 Tax=Lutibacter agarilyticus TaxID=1109740 RepID=A0A238YZ05_9FLAO|nr:CatB-related O-acetyltransferase [Lutibacter agarilyticus]SNR76212.1 Acetyltransferase (isoleucine patch superfamily) [Lutibacter agarilyticus]
MKLFYFFLKKIGFKLSKIDKSEDLPILEQKYRIGSNVEFSESEIGDYSYISPDSKFHSTKIGKYCSIGPNVICGYGEHPINFLSTSPLFYYGKKKFDIKITSIDYFEHHKKVIIKNDVWIGANVYIKNGITIGNGAIIGAGSVVVNDVEDYAVVVGVPAKVIKYRFEKEDIIELLKIKWWDLNIVNIDKLHHLFVDDNIKNVLIRLKNEIELNNEN